MSPRINCNTLQQLGRKASLCPHHVSGLFSLFSLLTFSSSQASRLFLELSRCLHFFSRPSCRLSSLVEFLSLWSHGQFLYQIQGQGPRGIRSMCWISSVNIGYSFIFHINLSFWQNNYFSNLLPAYASEGWHILLLCPATSLPLRMVTGTL